jgi:hypothetical protein
MVSNGVLSWGSTVDQGLRCERSIPLLKCSVKAEPNAARSNCFSIIQMAGSVMILQALTPWDMDQWLAVIQNSKLAQLSSVDPDDLASNPGSIICQTVCADCGAANSYWAAVNWGVTLCEACAGERRGLGSNVSKVRSLTLDEVERMHRALVEAIGTDRANQVLEAALPDGENVSEEATAEERCRFQERKYRDREFVTRPPHLDILGAIQRQDLIAVYACVAGGALAQMSGFTPVHAAAIVGNPLIMHFLCLNTNALAVCDDAGWSPLCYAAWHEQPKMIEVLLLYGADLDRGAVNPYDIAKERNSEGSMARLERSFAESSRWEEGLTFQLPDDRIQPAPFEFTQFVADPTLYSAIKPSDSRGDMPMRRKRRALNEVVSQVGQKLRGKPITTFNPDEFADSHN